MYVSLQHGTLRSLRTEDAPSIAHYANNRKVWLNLRDAFPHPYTLKDAEGFIAAIQAADPETVFAIAVDGIAVGAIGLKLNADVERCSAELGYWLGEPFWGQGLVTGAVQHITQWAIDAFDLTRVFAVPFAWNPASCRVLEKAGFVREGIMRRSAIKDGQILDQYLYAYVPKP